MNTEEQKQRIERLRDRILQGGAIQFEEAQELIEIELHERELLETLFQAAGDIQRAFQGKRIEACSLLNAKSGSCPEDCAFCAQSAFYKSPAAKIYPLMAVDQMVEAAKEAERRGAGRFCLVTSGGALSDPDFDRLVEAFDRIREETDLACDASIGFLTRGRIRRLKQAGVKRVNHNLETSEEFYPRIVRTHAWRDRLDTLRQLKEEGMEICSGGIIGMGESRLDRIRLAFALAEQEVDVVPINILHPRPRTPLEHQEKLDPTEIVKTVAVFRFLLPRVVIKIAGGREVNLGPHQVTALRSGSNGLIVGGYLTTAGNPIETDMELIRQAEQEDDHE